MFRVAFHQNNRQQHLGLVGKTRHIWSEAKISILILTEVTTLKRGKFIQLKRHLSRHIIKAGTIDRLVL